MNWYLSVKIAMSLPGANNYPVNADQVFTDIDKSLSQSDANQIDSDHPGMSYIGHGSNGIAYEQPDGQTVVKVTKSGRELANARMQMERELPCLVKVFDVQKVGSGGKIVMEKLIPLSDEEIAEIDRAIDIWNSTWKFPRDSSVAKQFESLWRSLEAYGIDTGDVYPRNIGKRLNEQLVLLDLG